MATECPLGDSLVEAEHTPSTSDATVGAAILTAKTLTAIVPLSVQLIEDAPNAGLLVENALTQILALELDRGILRGIGAANEPLGILNHPDITTTAIGGRPSFDDLLDARTPIEVANGMPNAWILSPTINGMVRKKKDGNGQYLLDHPDVNNLAKLVSNQCPDSETYFGTSPRLS